MGYDVQAIDSNSKAEEANHNVDSAVVQVGFDESQAIIFPVRMTDRAGGVRAWRWCSEGVEKIGENTLHSFSRGAPKTLQERLGCFDAPRWARGARGCLGFFSLFGTLFERDSVLRGKG